MTAREKEPIQLEYKSVNNIDSLSTSPLVKVKRIDLIGVNYFLCVLHPYLVDLVNSLKINII